LCLGGRSAAGDCVRFGTLPASGAFHCPGFHRVEHPVHGRRSGGRDAVVVVGIRGARGRGVRGVAVRAGPPCLLKRWNRMTLSLCETCALMREVVTPKGSRFLLCQLSVSNPDFPKYPPQPVVRCEGYLQKEQTKER